MGKADFRNVLKQIIDQNQVYENVVIPVDFDYYPKGIINPNEVELDKQRILINDSADYCDKLKSWWLEHPQRARTPVWDVVVTAQIDNKPGFILIEAKAHEDELKNEEKGKEKPRADASKASKENHSKIQTAIHEASDGLREATNNNDIPIDRDKCYQMSNRLAFAWKLANLGIPVVLIYLGFEKTTEMQIENQRQLIENYDQWNRVVRNHSSKIDFNLWESTIPILTEDKDQVINIYPMIRSLDIKLKDAALDTKYKVKYSDSLSV